MIPSWIIERFSRSLLNKKLLRDFLKTELDESQTKVVAQEQALYLYDLDLRTDTLNAALPPGCHFHISSARIDVLVIKFPTITEMRSRSGVVEIRAECVEVNFQSSPSEEKLPRENQLTASLTELSDALEREGKMAFEDRPDVDPTDADPEFIDFTGSHVRSNLERVIERALGATRLVVSSIKVQYHNTSELDGVSRTVGISVDDIRVTNNDSRIQSLSNVGPGKLVSKIVQFGSIRAFCSEDDSEEGQAHEEFISIGTDEAKACDVSLDYEHGEVDRCLNTSTSLDAIHFRLSSAALEIINASLQSHGEKTQSQTTASSASPSAGALSDGASSSWRLTNKIAVKGLQVEAEHGETAMTLKLNDILLRQFAVSGSSSSWQRWTTRLMAATLTCGTGSDSNAHVLHLNFDPWMEDAQPLSSDIRSARDIIKSSTSANLKVHLLSPLLLSSPLLSSCFAACQWDPALKKFAAPLTDCDQLQEAEEELVALHCSRVSALFETSSRVEQEKGGEEGEAAAGRSDEEGRQSRSLLQISMSPLRGQLELSSSLRCLRDLEVVKEELERLQRVFGTREGGREGATASWQSSLFLHSLSFDVSLDRPSPRPLPPALSLHVRAVMAGFSSDAQSVHGELGLRRLVVSLRKGGLRCRDKEEEEVSPILVVAGHSAKTDVKIAFDEGLSFCAAPGLCKSSSSVNAEGCWRSSCTCSCANKSACGVGMWGCGCSAPRRLQVRGSCLKIQMTRRDLEAITRLQLDIIAMIEQDKGLQQQQIAQQRHFNRKGNNGNSQSWLESSMSEYVEEDSCYMSAVQSLNSSQWFPARSGGMKEEEGRLVRETSSSSSRDSDKDIFRIVCEDEVEAVPLRARVLFDEVSLKLDDIVLSMERANLHALFKSKRSQDTQDSSAGAAAAVDTIWLHTSRVCASLQEDCFLGPLQDVSEEFRPSSSAMRARGCHAEPVEESKTSSSVFFKLTRTSELAHKEHASISFTARCCGLVFVTDILQRLELLDPLLKSLSEMWQVGGATRGSKQGHNTPPPLPPPPPPPSLQSLQANIDVLDTCVLAISHAQNANDTASKMEEEEVEEEEDEEEEEILGSRKRIRLMTIVSRVSLDFSSSPQVQPARARQVESKSEEVKVKLICHSDIVHVFLLNPPPPAPHAATCMREIVDYMRDCGHIELLHMSSFHLDLSQENSRVDLVASGPDVQFGACVDSLNSLLLFSQSPLVTHLLSFKSPPSEQDSGRKVSRARRMEAQQEEEEEEDWEPIHTGDVEERMLRESVVKLFSSSSSPRRSLPYDMEEDHFNRANLRSRRRERRERRERKQQVNVLLRDVHVCLRLFGGEDLRHRGEAGRTERGAKREQHLLMAELGDDVVSVSSCSGRRSESLAQESWRLRGGRGRQEDRWIEVYMQQGSLQLSSSKSGGAGEQEKEDGEEDEFSCLLTLHHLEVSDGLFKPAAGSSSEFSLLLHQVERADASSSAIRHSHALRVALRQTSAKEEGRRRRGGPGPGPGTGRRTCVTVSACPMQVNLHEVTAVFIIKLVEAFEQERGIAASASSSELDQDFVRVDLDDSHVVIERGGGGGGGGGEGQTLSFFVIRPSYLKLNLKRTYEGELEAMETEKLLGGYTERLVNLVMRYLEGLPAFSLPGMLVGCEGDLSSSDLLSRYARRCQKSLIQQCLAGLYNRLKVPIRGACHGFTSALERLLGDSRKLRGVHRGLLSWSRALVHAAAAAASSS